MGDMRVRASKVTWMERVRAWRVSGQTPEQFSRGKGFSPATLRWWGSRLRQDVPPRFVELVPRRSAPVPPQALVVEIGPARIRIEPGFDPALLAAVVGAMGGAR